MRAALKSAAVFVVSLATICPAALAHPLGNFSVNQYFLLDMRGDVVQVAYLLDIAEVPSFTEMDLLDTDFDNEISDAEVDAYLDAKVPSLMEKISLRLEDQDIPLQLKTRKLVLLEGTGGMTVFNILLRLEAQDWEWPGAHEGFNLTLESLNHEGESGIRECKILLDGRVLNETDSFDRQTLKYQTLMLVDEKDNPVYQDFDASFLFRFAAGSGTGPTAAPSNPEGFAWTATARAAGDAGETAIIDGMKTALAEEVEEAEFLSDFAERTEREKGDEGVAGTLLERVTAVIRTKELSMSMFGVGLLIAAALGMGHAFSPGHGKTVMAAYLIGERGTMRHAAILGLIVTFTHVWSVIALGMVTLYAGGRVSEEDLSFWTGIASGAIITIIGGVLFMRRYSAYVLRRNAAAAKNSDAHHHHGEHEHNHSHDHHHGHGHDHHHGHSHVVETKDGAPPSYKSIVWLGISGGIVPCPAALIVLLLAIKFGRVLLGIWLIVAFSIGLAAVLVAIGIAVVRTSGEIRKRIGEESVLLLALPVASSVLISVLGLWVILWTLLQHDVVVFMPMG